MKIRKDVTGFTIFEYKIEKLSHMSFMKSCEECGGPLELGYIGIINTLKRTNLLNKDFKMLCCDCFTTEEKRCEVCGEMSRAYHKIENSDGVICYHCLRLLEEGYEIQ